MTEYEEWEENRNRSVYLALLGLYETVEIRSGGMFCVTDHTLKYHLPKNKVSAIWPLTMLRDNVKIGRFCYNLHHS